MGVWMGCEHACGNCVDGSVESQCPDHLYKEAEEVDDEAQDGSGHAARPVAVDGLVQHNDLEKLVDVPGRGKRQGSGFRM